MPYADPVVAKIKAAEAHQRRQATRRYRKVLDRRLRISNRPRKAAIDLAWAAGLFEGEGTVTLSANAAMRSRPVISVSNTDRDVVEFFHQRWAGSIRTRMPSSKTGNCREVHNWSLNAGEAVEAFILDLLPFIRTTRVRAKMQLVLADIVDRFANTQQPEVYVRSSERVALIRKLNHRGL